MDYWIKYRTDAANNQQVQKHTHYYLAGSQAVKQSLIEILKIPQDKIEVVHNFITLQAVQFNPESRDQIRQQLKLPTDAFVVGAAGTTDWRKGPDIFIQLARAVYQRQPERPVHFLWVGGASVGPEFGALWHDVKRIGLEDCIHFVGAQANFRDYFALFDVFVLVSREDPFPLVNLEAAALGKPCLCFAGAGGAPEFVENDGGFVVPYLDTETMADRVMDLLNSVELRQRLGQRAAEKVREQFDINWAAPKILGIIERFREKVFQPS
jgi:glycosyltransferase involved in cell wall biosynthesis